MKNKKLILGIGGFIAFLGLVYVAYNGLSEEYTDKLNKGSNSDITNGDVDNENNQSGGEAESEKAIDFNVYDEDLNKVKLSDYIGTPVVLNFWASWCPPCKEEMPFFQEASDKYNDEVKILMINMTDGQRETQEKAINYMKDNNYTMEMLMDIDYEVASGYGVAAIPRTIFIDKDGYIKEDKIGVMDEDSLNSKIEELINE